MSSGVIFILGKGVSPILAYGVKPTWPQGASAPGFSSCVCLCYYAIIKFLSCKASNVEKFS